MTRRCAKDRVIETPDGYDCVVNGIRYGTWRSRAEAVGGMQTERQRLTKREPAELVESDDKTEDAT